MNNLYENDYNQWIEKQKLLLLSKNFNDLDIENLVKELVSMSKQDAKELVSFLNILITHLLKYNYQKTVLKNDWVEDRVVHTWYPSIDGPRIDILRHIKENPNLKTVLNECLKKAYKIAKEKAVIEMNRYIKDNKKKLNDKSFPEQCPWSFDQIVSEDWLPEEKI